jgi:hypothetical protein
MIGNPDNQLESANEIGFWAHAISCRRGPDERDESGRMDQLSRPAARNQPATPAVLTGGGSEVLSIAAAAASRELLNQNTLLRLLTRGDHRCLRLE